MNTQRFFNHRTIIALGYLALLAFMTGCGPQRQWTKTGLNQADFDRDAAQCRRDARKATYQDPFANGAGQDQGLERSMAQNSLFEQCMFAKGYRLTDGPSER